MAWGTTPITNQAQQYQHSDVWNQPWAQQANPYANNVSMANAGVGDIRNMMGPGFGAAGTGGSGSSWGMHVARPGDPDMEAYRQYLLGAEERPINELIKRGATAGVQRGGTNVAGGPALGTGLWKQGMDTLAGQAAGNVKTAMDYGKYVSGAQNEGERYMLGAYNTAQAQALAAEQASAGWDARRLGMRREDWQKDQDTGWDQWSGAAKRARQNQQEGMALNQGQFGADQQQRNQGLTSQLMYSRPDPGANPWITSTNEYLRAQGTIPNKYYGGYGGGRG